jgi:hypothetical protein
MTEAAPLVAATDKEQMYMAATGAQPILYSMQEGPSLFGRQHQ